MNILNNRVSVTIYRGQDKQPYAINVVVPRKLKDKTDQGVDRWYLDDELMNDHLTSNNYDGSIVRPLNERRIKAVLRMIERFGFSEQLKNGEYLFVSIYRYDPPTQEMIALLQKIDRIEKENAILEEINRKLRNLEKTGVYE